MKRGGDPSAPPDDAVPDMPAADDDQGATPDSSADVAMQAALDAIDQGADAYGDQVATEIRDHINAIRELVSQGETGSTDDEAAEDQGAPPDSQSGPDTQGMESQTPATQATDGGGGFPA
jgi:hypothetical protein